METEPRGNELNGAGPCACRVCGANISVEDNYCRKCGQGQGRFVHWYYKHFGIVFLTFCAGLFSLYFVWRSPVLSRNAKWAYTGFIILASWYMLSVLYRFWVSFQAALGGLQLQY